MVNGSKQTKNIVHHLFNCYHKRGDMSWIKKPPEVHSQQII